MPFVRLPDIETLHLPLSRSQSKTLMVTDSPPRVCTNQVPFGGGQGSLSARRGNGAGAALAFMVSVAMEVRMDKSAKAQKILSLPFIIHLPAKTGVTLGRSSYANMRFMLGTSAAVIPECLQGCDLRLTPKVPQLPNPSVTGVPTPIRLIKRRDPGRALQRSSKPGMQLTSELAISFAATNGPAQEFISTCSGVYSWRGKDQSTRRPRNSVNLLGMARGLAFPTSRPESKHGANPELQTLDDVVREPRAARSDSSFHIPRARCNSVKKLLLK